MHGNMFCRPSVRILFTFHYRAEAQRLEKPVETALLLGLTGVRSVCLNQWHCTLSENAERLDVTMKGICRFSESGIHL